MSRSTFSVIRKSDDKVFYVAYGKDHALGWFLDITDDPDFEKMNYSKCALFDQMDLRSMVEEAMRELDLDNDLYIQIFL